MNLKFSNMLLKSNEQSSVNHMSQKAENLKMKVLTSSTTESGIAAGQSGRMERVKQCRFTKLM